VSLEFGGGGVHDEIPGLEAAPVGHVLRDKHG